MFIKQAKHLTCAAALTFVAATVAALQTRANELASQLVKPLLLEMEMKAMMGGSICRPPFPARSSS